MELVASVLAEVLAAFGFEALSDRWRRRAGVDGGAYVLRLPRSTVVLSVLVLPLLVLVPALTWDEMKGGAVRILVTGIMAAAVLGCLAGLSVHIRVSDTGVERRILGRRRFLAWGDVAEVRVRRTGCIDLRARDGRKIHTAHSLAGLAHLAEAALAHAPAGSMIPHVRGALTAMASRRPRD